MKRKLPFIVALLAVWIGSQSCHKASQHPNPVKTIYTIDGLFSITGNWSTLGMTSRAALTLAASDINAYLANKNADFRVATSIYDTQLIADTAVKDFALAVKSGTHFIIGPQSSAELAALIPEATTNSVIVVSQGSTAGSLAIAGDPIFRFCPPDKVEGAAIADTIYKAGIKGLVTVARNDAGNLGLQTATGASFTTLGGHVSAITPYSTTITDFSTQINAIRDQVNDLTNTYGAGNVAIYLASFDECTALFDQAASDPVLNSVHWYGGDGVALSTVLTADAAASDFAIKTGFFAPTFGLPQALKDKWQPIATSIQSSTGIAPDAFALAAYDAMWVIAHTLEASDGKNLSFDQLKTTFEAQANSYTGITGSTALDANGDRDSGAFDYYGITKTGTAYGWVVVGESN